MKFSLAGLVIVLGLGGTLYAFSRHSVHRAKTVPATASSVNNSAVVIQAKAPQPLFSYQQKTIAETALKVIQNPPQQSFDASSFTQYVYAKAGLSLPRTIAEQSQVGTKVAHRRNLTEGDLVFFDLGTSPSTVTFVGIYLQNGEIAAETTHGLRTFNMNSSYWSNKFQFGVRLSG